MYPENTQFIITYLNFEKNYAVDQSRTLAKSFLKTNKMDLIIYNWYAQLERKTGKIEEVRIIFSGRDLHTRMSQDGL